MRPRGTFGFAALRFRARTVPAGGALPFRARATLARPRLWWPKDPFLHPVTIDAGPARHTLRTAAFVLAIGRVAHATDLRGV